MPASSKKSLLEVQFPIGQLSLESYLERDGRTGKILNSLGKWWGTKPIVLTRSVILGSLFEASDDPDRWPEDLEVFLKLLCFDNAGMWKRRNEGLKEISSRPPSSRFVELCHPHARPDELDLFKEQELDLALPENDDPVRWRTRLDDKELARREALEKRVFYTLGHEVQRRYCKRMEEIDGPPPESWEEINAYSDPPKRVMDCTPDSFVPEHALFRRTADVPPYGRRLDSRKPLRRSFQSGCHRFRRVARRAYRFGQSQARHSPDKAQPDAARDGRLASRDFSSASD